MAVIGLKTVSIPQAESGLFSRDPIIAVTQSFCEFQFLKRKAASLALKLHAPQRYQLLVSIPQAESGLFSRAVSSR